MFKVHGSRFKGQRSRCNGRNGWWGAFEWDLEALRGLMAARDREGAVEHLRGAEVSRQPSPHGYQEVQTPSGKAVQETELCRAPKELLASELLGYERGAFTGAIGRRIGLLAASRPFGCGGMIFLSSWPTSSSTTAKSMGAPEEGYEVGHGPPLFVSLAGERPGAGEGDQPGVPSASLPLNLRQQEALRLAATTGSVRPEELIARFGVSGEAIRRDLKALVEARLLSREGACKASRYFFP